MGGQAVSDGRRSRGRKEMNCRRNFPMKSFNSSTEFLFHYFFFAINFFSLSSKKKRCEFVTGSFKLTSFSSSFLNQFGTTPLRVFPIFSAWRALASRKNMQFEKWKSIPHHFFSLAAFKKTIKNKILLFFKN